LRVILITQFENIDLLLGISQSMISFDINAKPLFSSLKN
jgi:hypothetical protein